MSLIIGMCYKDQFVMVSNDSKVTTQFHDENYNRINDEVKETGISAEKVFYLSKYVLLCVSGLVDACDLVRRELEKRVSPEDDLSVCSDIIEKLLSDLKGDAIDGLTKEERNFVKVLNTIHFNCDLVGFDKETRVTGLAKYSPVESTLTRTDAPIEKKGYPIFIDCPDPENDLAFQSYLDLPTNEQTFENFINAFLLIHAHLSHKHIGISSDCNFHILMKDGEKLKYIKQTVETSDFYEQLGLT